MLYKFRAFVFVGSWYQLKIDKTHDNHKGKIYSKYTKDKEIKHTTPEDHEIPKRTREEERNKDIIKQPENS